MMSGSEGARRLGERLLKEVQVDDLSSIFHTIRLLTLPEADRSHFGIPELDALLPALAPPQLATATDLEYQHARDENHSTWNPGSSSPPRAPHFQTRSDQQLTGPKFRAPVLELISPPPSQHLSGAGKTSLLYLIIANAILPPTFQSTKLSGQNATIILLDPLSHFSVSRLAEVLLLLVTSQLRKDGKDIDSREIRQELKTLIQQCLLHVHIFSPQSWSATLSTLESLPTYLFDATRHRSSARRIQSIILEDIHTFVPGIKNAGVLLQSNSSTTYSSSSSSSSSMQKASTNLTSLLSALSTQFSAAIILTSHSVPNFNSSSTVASNSATTSTSTSSFRPIPPLPTSWPQNTPLTRLALRRVHVLPFAPGISCEEAESERGKRWEIVQRGRFECWRVGGAGGALASAGRSGEGFMFRVGRGVEVERTEREAEAELDQGSEEERRDHGPNEEAMQS